MSRQKMLNEYMAPYEAAFKAGAGSGMTSFNLVDGIPATGNRWLLTSLLRDKWQWKGFMVTDYNAINEMVAHGVGDSVSVASLALTAGTDMDMQSNAFIDHLKGALERGEISQTDIDTACRRVLEAKYRLGLFADPYRYIDASRTENDQFKPEHLAAARNIAASSMVLLKNDMGCCH